MSEKRKTRAGIALLGAGVLGYFALSGDSGPAGFGGGGFGASSSESEPEPQMPRGGMDGDPDTSPVEDTAPESQSGEPQTQTIASGTMTGPDEETTMETRSKRREMFSSTDDPDTISDRGNSPEESDTVSTETMSGETSEERGQQREAFASTEDPDDIIQLSDEDRNEIQEIREETSSETPMDPELRRQEDGSTTITGGGL